MISKVVRLCFLILALSLLITWSTPVSAAGDDFKDALMKMHEEMDHGDSHEGHESGHEQINGQTAPTAESEEARRNKMLTEIDKKEHKHSEAMELANLEYFQEPWRLPVTKPFLKKRVMVLGGVFVILLCITLIPFLLRKKGVKKDEA